MKTTSWSVDRLIKSTRCAVRDSGNYSAFGRLNPRYHKDGLDLRVTKQNATRALLFFERLLRALKATGHGALVEDKRTYLVINEQKVRVHVIERTKKVELPDQGYSWKQYDYTPTGVLSFVIEEYSSAMFKKCWMDGKTPLEDQIDDITNKLVSAAEILKREDEEREAQHRIWQEERRLAEEERRKREEDNKRFAELQTQADKWRQYGVLTAFLAECERVLLDQGRGSLTPAVHTWLAWARGRADQLDPFKMGFLSAISAPLKGDLNDDERL